MKNYIQTKRAKTKNAPARKHPEYTAEQRQGKFNFDSINGLKLTPMTYTVPPLEERKRRRAEFDGDYKKGIEGIRSKFLKMLANEHEQELISKLGLTRTDINRMKRGIGPKGYNVHHKVPLHGGGTNDFSNFILTPVYPHDQFHQDVMNAQIGGMKEGDSRTILVPYTTDMIYNPKEFGFKKENQPVQPNPPTRCNPRFHKYSMKNYRPEHISVEKRQKYMQPIYDADRAKAMAYAEKEKKGAVQKKFLAAMMNRDF